MLISVTRHTHPVYSLLPTIYKVYSIVYPTWLCRTVQVKQNVLDSGMGVSLEWHAGRLTEATRAMPSLT